jgi:hypothetical protein
VLVRFAPQIVQVALLVILEEVWAEEAEKEIAAT